MCARWLTLRWWLECSDSVGKLLVRRGTECAAGSHCGYSLVSRFRLMIQDSEGFVVSRALDAVRFDKRKVGRICGTRICLSILGADEESRNRGQRKQAFVTEEGSNV